MTDITETCGIYWLMITCPLFSVYFHFISSILFIKQICKKKTKLNTGLEILVTLQPVVDYYQLGLVAFIVCVLVFHSIYNIIYILCLLSISQYFLRMA